jgi:DNA replication licensing factor MCM4
MSSPASARRRGRPTRNSTTSTPTHSGPSQQQVPEGSPMFAAMDSTPSQNASGATPRSSRRLHGEAALQSSSPMFFQSSPANGTHPPTRNRDNETGVRFSSPVRPSSPPGDGEVTPRGNRRAVGGTYSEEWSSFINASQGQY